MGWGEKWEGRGGCPKAEDTKDGRMWSGPQGEHCRNGGWDASGDGVCRGAFCHHLGVWGASGSVGNTTHSQDGQAGLAWCPGGISSDWLQIMPSSFILPSSLQGKVPFSIEAAGLFFQTDFEAVSSLEN